MRKLLILLCTTSALSFAAPVCADETAITIYSKAQPGAMNPNSYRPVAGQRGYNGANVPGYAVVRQQRKVSLPKKQSIIKFTDVAALIDPTTVQFTSLTDPKGTKVAEQDYQFDLVSQQKLLQKYIDKDIAVETTVGDAVEVVKGTLISTQGGIVLKTEDGSIKTVNSYASIIFPALPGGLITKPTLVWDVITGKPGMHNTQVSYQTQGITWWADYNLTYKEGKNANSGTVDFGSWVSIINQTGATFTGAKLKLMAGDVQRITSPQPHHMRMAKTAMLMDAVAESPAFDEKAFFEYHLYTLNRPVTLPDNATKQMELIPAATDVPVEKLMLYTGVSRHFWNEAGSYYHDRNYGIEKGNKKVDVYLKILNKKENGLGAPLPAGRMRVNQRDSDGSLEFIGEDIINHTARNEQLLIKLGSAFDVVGERKQLSYTVNSKRKMAEEEIEIRIRNQKKQSVTVKIVESLYRAADWTMEKTSQKYIKDNARQIHYLVTVAPEKEAVVRYTVRYTW